MPTSVTTCAEALERIASDRARLQAMGVASISLFGSITRDSLSDASDVDVLIEFAEPVGAFEFLEVQAHLEELLGRPVDLVTRGAIKDRMRDRILGEAVRAA